MNEQKMNVDELLGYIAIKYGESDPDVIKLGKLHKEAIADKAEYRERRRIELAKKRERRKDNAE